MRSGSIWVALAALVAVQSASMPARADWLSRLGTLADRTGVRVERAASGLDAAAAQVKRLPAAKGAALAAHVGSEGHWTFVNRAGERYTAGTPEELKRVMGVLAPEVRADQRLTLMLTEDAVFKHRGLLKDLPRNADLMIAIEKEAYPLVRRAGAGETLFAEVRPNVLIELGERAAFDEAAWQLARPLDRARIRVLALEPGGPVVLAPSPRLDPQTRRALTDAIDPDKLAPALRSIAGQTAVLTGRIAGDQLVFRTASGVERSLVLKDLQEAALAADVNLVILQSATPRQPGARNWLWQRATVDGLERAVERAHLADFFNALGIDQSRLLVSAMPSGPGRVTLRAVPMTGESAPLSSLSGIFSEIVSEVAGKVVTTGVEASMRSAERQREVDQRLVAWLPSSVQNIYLGLMVLGLMGLATARRWWGRIWPAERREGYGGAFGYLAAAGLRLAAFVLVFMPVVAVVSAPRSALDGLRSLFGRSAARASTRGASPA